MRQNVSRVKCVLIGLFVNGSLHHNESIAAFNQRFIFPRPFAMKIIKINLWNQGSFRPNHSTESALHKSVMYWYKHMDKGDIGIAV
jgi:hypothetical protein